jgi:hypothetical protein
MLLLAAGIGKTQINETGFIVCNHLHYIGDRHGSALLKSKMSH